MKVIKQRSAANGLKFTTSDSQGREIARAYLYLLRNSLHPEPFGLMEDVYVDEQYRSQGLGTQLVKAIIAAAKKSGCYKLIATSRESRVDVHELYQHLGFVDYGREFRIDF